MLNQRCDNDFIINTNDVLMQLNSEQICNNKLKK